WTALFVIGVVVDDGENSPLEFDGYCGESGVVGVRRMEPNRRGLAHAAAARARGMLWVEGPGSTGVDNDIDLLRKATGMDRDGINASRVSRPRICKEITGACAPARGCRRHSYFEAGRDRSGQAAV